MWLKLLICALLFMCSLMWTHYHCPKTWEGMEFHDWFLMIAPIWVAFLFAGCY